MVETNRLTIFPLTYKQLRLYLEGKNKFEKKLGLALTSRVVSDDIKERVVFFILPLVKSAKKDNFLFHTFWVVIDKASQTVVAELGFKGPPNDKGEIEIGYGSFWGERNKGIMTEAVAGMLIWAKSRGTIRYVLAETDEQNLASIRVLQKNNFEVFKRIQGMLWWRVEVNPKPSC